MRRRHDSIIVQKISKLLIPFIQLFALYVFFHGHHSPGGGFQAGVLIGASFILMFLVGMKKETQHFSVRREFLIAVLGLGIFLGIGAVSLFFGGELFDYSKIPFLGEVAPYRRYFGILIAEGGVLLVVSMTLVVITHVLAFLPVDREGETC
ncbi:MAG: cation:proton antiporter [Candidatus Omnitrophica bacterium]|nr:cation:proton antiporter [Candidatus Omnitrophota bacterium]